jgi:hypothetical protein
MASSGIRPAARLGRASLLAIAAALLLAACSSSAATSAPGAAATTPPSAAPVASTAATVAPTPVPTKGPATQNLTIAGPAGASGAVSLAAIRCNLPPTDGTSGLQISVLGRPTDPNLSVYIFVSPGNVTVRYDSGSGATYVERDFAGTSVTGFDAATGAQIDSPLTEVLNKDAHGTLGVLTSISGSIDCGNQLPGSSTLTFSGPTLKGALSGGLSLANVECVTNSFGQSVSVLGMVTVGTTPTAMVMSISPGTFTVYPVGAGFYRNTATAVATLTATGAHIDGDGLEQNVAKGATAHTIHVTGDVVCGTTIGS